MMVYLSRIYTKTGDQGDTGLGDGSRVPKDHPRVAAYGSVDELNAVLGLLLAHVPDAAESDLLRGIQNDLFDVGADLCVPQTADEAAGARLRVRPEQSARLEAGHRPPQRRPDAADQFHPAGRHCRRRPGATWPAPSAAAPSATW